jgi:hypothetical protein
MWVFTHTFGYTGQYESASTSIHPDAHVCVFVSLRPMMIWDPFPNQLPIVARRPRLHAHARAARQAHRPYEGEGAPGVARQVHTLGRTVRLRRPPPARVAVPVSRCCASVPRSRSRWAARCGGARPCVWSVAASRAARRARASRGRPGLRAGVAGPTGFTRERGGADGVYARARRGRPGLRAGAAGPTGFTRERGGADRVYARARRGRPGLRASAAGPTGFTRGGADRVCARSGWAEHRSAAALCGAQGRVQHRARGAAGGVRLAEPDETVSATYRYTAMYLCLYASVCSIHLGLCVGSRLCVCV